MTLNPSHPRVAGVNNPPECTCAKRHQPPATFVSHPDISIISAQACYPTPPSTPDREEGTLPSPTPPLSTTSLSSSIVTVQLEDLDDLDLKDNDLKLADFNAELESSQRLPVIPIPILLNTPHDLPQTATFRLRSPASILALFAGSRVLSLDSNQSIWDRMPYSAAAAAIHAHRPATEEDAVESIVGGTKVDRKVNGLHWNMRQQK